ncbi:PEP-CTERM sorting domain-containing protein [Desulforhopalus sp. 52FAK]
MKNFKRLFLTIFTVCVAGLPAIAQSSLISCVLEDLDDSQGAGGDLWQATYTLGTSNWSDPLVRSGAVIEIRLWGVNYESIEWVDNDINSIFEPDYWLAGRPLNSFDKTLTFTASRAHLPYEDIGNDFSIQFIWTGVDDPGGSQYWSLYLRELDYVESRFDGLGTVNIDEIIHLEAPVLGPSNAPVPEPATILLFGAGLAGIAMGRRRIRKS